jgi:hypothetical protein
VETAETVPMAAAHNHQVVAVQAQVLQVQVPMVHLVAAEQQLVAQVHIPAETAEQQPIAVIMAATATVMQVLHRVVVAPARMRSIQVVADLQDQAVQVLQVR